MNIGKIMFIVMIIMIVDYSFDGDEEDKRTEKSNFDQGHLPNPH